MSRWAELTGGRSGEQYAARFAELAESGKDVHGEARFCAALREPGASVLDAGCGTGRVAIWLAAQGYDCVGVDIDPSMLAVARREAPELPWFAVDLAELSLDRIDRAEGFDIVVAAGNIIPLVAAGTEPAVVRNLASMLRPDGLLIAGFGLDAAHLPLSSASTTLADYDRWCAAAGLRLSERFGTWDGAPYDGGGYAVSVHQPSRH
ncbi:class I SAM-dependent methyltransferase [Tamaricihabitans halophyticus]|nr:methyltransferase domain-containing protein [Tamaricihabitans halophyticus]